MNYEALLRAVGEAQDRINTGEKLEGLYYQVVMASLAKLGYAICRQEGWPGAGMVYHDTYERLMAASEGPLQEWECQQEGKQIFHVFYLHGNKRTGKANPNLTTKQVLQDFLHLHEIEAETIDGVFSLTQEADGLHPMSVGDVVRDEDGVFWQANDIGWLEVIPKGFDAPIPFMGEPVPVPDDGGNGLASGVDF